MNLVSAAPAWLVALLLCAMVAAALEDVARFRISNITSLAVFALAIIAALIEGPSWALWQNMLVFLVLLVLGTAAFSAGWLGGGDVKLLASSALWFDLRSATTLLALVFLSGGMVALGYVLSRPLRRLRHDAPNHGRVPYGLPIALGIFLMIFIGPGPFHHVQRASPMTYVPLDR